LWGQGKEGVYGKKKRKLDFREEKKEMEDSFTLGYRKKVNFNQPKFHYLKYRRLNTGGGLRKVMEEIGTSG